MPLISFLLRSSWTLVAVAVFTGFVSGGSSASLIALISEAVGRSTTSLSTISIVLGFFGLAVVTLITSIISQVFLIRLSQNAVFQLRMHLSRQILASELSHLEKLGNSQLLATLTEDIQAVSNAVYVIPFLCIDLAIVIGCLSYLAWLSWGIILMIFGFLALATGSCQSLLKNGERSLALAREQQDLLFGHFRSLITGSKELKLHYQRRQAFFSELQSTVAAFRHDSIRGLTLFAAVSSCGKVLFFLAVGFVLFILPHLLVTNPQTLSSYILTFAYFMRPMEGIVNDLPILSKAGIALQKIESLGLSLACHAETATTLPKCQSSWLRLEFSRVTHTYVREQEDCGFTLGPIDLTLLPGELVFITGGNGSGKSTLAKLITGLYIPEFGEIWLDGQRISQQNREWYRQFFSVVFSDFYLFKRLLGLENIKLVSQAQNYLRLLQLEQKVKIENGKFSTTDLSQGQRKRLALLTAYLEDRPIYLFDEWAADQDPVFKKIFYTQLLPELKSRDKTVLVITHDDQFFYLAERIIKLEYGQVKSDRYML